MKKFKVCVLDHGMYISFAQALSETDNWEVFYSTVWIKAFPNRADRMYGEGMPGIIRIDDVFGSAEDFNERGYLFDEVDLFVVCDLYYAPVVAHLKSLGKKVWAAGMGEELELYRWEARDKMKELGLDVNKAKRVVGVEELRNELKKSEDKFIKISKFRGLMETWHHENYEMSQPRLDKIEHNLGCIKYIQEFIIEDPIETEIELGIDTWYIGGNCPNNVIFGYEGKDKAYICTTTTYNKLPKQIIEVHDKLKPYFEETEYAGLYSSEIRVGKDKKNYLIDSTCRNPSPPTEIMCKLITNLGEVVNGGANGEVVEPVFKTKYAVQVAIFSNWASQNELPIYIEKEAEPWVKLRNACKINDVYYILPSDDLIEVGMVVGLGNTIDEAIKEAVKYSEMVKGIKIEIQTQAFDEVKKVIKEGEKLGIMF